MAIFAGVMFLLALVAAFFAQIAKRENTKLEYLNHTERELTRDLFARIRVFEAEADVRNQYLDYVLTTFSLHITNPFVERPGFEEKRCFHSHYPEYATEHDKSCAWMKLRPLTSILYPPPTLPPASTAETDGDTVFPVEPEPETEEKA